MSEGNRRKKTEADEVEELLRVAEDEVLLKLSLNSHLKSDKAIDPDLDHRFQALKSRRSKPKPNPNPNRSSPSVVLPNPTPVTGDFDGGNHEKPEADDLFARFAALKGTIPSYSSSSTTTTTTAANSSNQQRKSNDDDADDDDEDEVDKVIRWAIDAARLDPSPSSDDDDDDSHSDDTDDEDSLDGKHKGHIK